MKAVWVEKIGGFTIRDIEIPKPGPDEVLVRVSVSGLCRTDLKLIRVGHRDLALPCIPGEEVVGVIEALGAEVKNYSERQRVYLYPGASCGVCGPCRSGAENLCRDMRIMGFHRYGGFAEYVVAPARSLIPVPDSMTDEEAVFAEPLSCCLNALEQSRLKAGETIGIWGAGPAGALLARAAHALGAIVTGIDPDKRRADLINGMTRPPEAVFDVAVVAIGNRDAYREALDHLGPRGRLVLFSGLAPADGVVEIDFNRFHYLEQALVGAYGCSYRHGEQALAAISRGAIQVANLVSHAMPLGELDKALDLVERRACMKIHLYPS